MTLLVIGGFARGVRTDRDKFATLPNGVSLVTEHYSVLFSRLFRDTIVRPFFVDGLQLFFGMGAMVAFRVALGAKKLNYGIRHCLTRWNNKGFHHVGI